MITLVFMTDSRRVVGGSTTLRNLVRLPFLPVRELSPAMNELLSGDHVVMGARSVSYYKSRARDYETAWILTTDPKRHVDGFETCIDPKSLIERFSNSEEELLVVGGLSTWRMFLPYATFLRIAQTYRDVPGDLVFDDWDDGSFEIISEKRGAKLCMCICQRVESMG